MRGAIDTMNNQKLNNLVLDYKLTKSDAIFAEIYQEVSKDWRNLQTVASSIRADVHELTAVYENALMKCVTEYNGLADFIHFYRVTATRLRTNLYNKNKRYYEKIDHEYGKESTRDDEMAATIENIADDEAVEDIAFAKRKADQRRLIDSLLSDSDELTTAIVKAFLEHPKPTPTAIGKQLGIHHSTIIRKLERLAGKFDSKKHGDYRDFLVAM
jgi:hypothetical protein